MSQNPIMHIEQQYAKLCQNILKILQPKYEGKPKGKVL